jgi:two-component system, LuxR family, response regulator FixJ
MPEDCNLYVVDDEVAVLKSVESVLVQFGLSPVCFSSAELFLKEAVQDAPGCIVTDLSMPGMNGLQLQETLVANSSPLSVIFLTGLADVPTTVRIMRNGATTLLVKPYATQELVSAVQNALKSSQVRWQLVCQQQKARAMMATLTEEEKAVMKMMLDGVPNKNIASSLDIGMRTVDRRRQAVFSKMGVSTVAELAVLVSCLSQEPDRR